MAKINQVMVILTALIIQGSMLLFLNIGGKQPDLLLIVVICFSILWGSRTGAFIGLAGGFLQDILFGRALGIFALTKMLVGYLSGFTEKNIYKDFVIGPMIIVFALTFLHEGLVFILSKEVIRQSVGPVFTQLIVPKALYNFCLTPFIYLIIYFADQKNYFKSF
ncbi:MAG: rod shape-determining protein MreD [Firmicutes bacterium HGW-Firmicutes-13]|nr:MAG: rod shape-determining protein MreD [Firmicutes bacterium HGW-Firmicutes-13]